MYYNITYRFCQASNENSNMVSDWHNLDNYVISAESGSDARVLTCGKLRTISFRGQNRVHVEDEVFLTLPASDRPIANVFTTANVGDKSVAVIIGANGNVSIYSLNSATDNNRLYFGCSYITA